MKIFILILGLLFTSLVFGQQLMLNKKGNVVRVRRGDKFLYRVTLQGKQNFKGRSYDEAFLAGECLIVSRNVREIATEEPTFPTISRIEVYQANGKHRIYRKSKDLNLYLVYEHDIINSPDHSWAIIPENSEETFWGYHHISSDCKITEIRFQSPHFDYFDWNFDNNRIFLDAETLKFPLITKHLSSTGGTKTVEIYITKDGKYHIEEVIK